MLKIKPSEKKSLILVGQSLGRGDQSASRPVFHKLLLKQIETEKMREKETERERKR